MNTYPEEEEILNNDTLQACMVCEVKFLGEEPKTRCSSRDCGRMGFPTDPVVCSKIVTIN